MLSNVITKCTISPSLAGIPEHSFLSSRRSCCIHIFFDNYFSMGHLISSVSPSHITMICVSRTHLWGGAKILHHTHDCVTNDLSPSIDPPHTQHCDLWSTLSLAFPSASTGMINHFKVCTLPTTSALIYLARWHSSPVVPWWLSWHFDLTFRTFKSYSVFPLLYWISNLTLDQPSSLLALRLLALPNCYNRFLL